MAAGVSELARTATRRRSSSGTKRDVRAPEIVGMRAMSAIDRAFRLQNTDEASPAAHVTAAALRVDEQIIGITAGLGGGDQPAAGYRENAKLGRRPEDHRTSRRTVSSAIGKFSP